MIKPPLSSKYAGELVKHSLWVDEGVPRNDRTLLKKYENKAFLIVVWYNGSIMIV